MQTSTRLAIFFGSCFLLLQFIRFDRTNPISDPALELKADTQVMSILKKSCYDCHSNNTVWPWYSNIAPVSWIVVSDVDSGRGWLNFSEWESYNEAKKEKLKKLMYREVLAAMPLQIYVNAHPDSKLTEEQKNIIRNWTGVSAGTVTMRD